MTQNDRRHRQSRSTRASKRLGTAHNNQNTRQQISDYEARDRSPSTRAAVVAAISKSTPQLTDNTALNIRMIKQKHLKGKTKL